MTWARCERPYIYPCWTIVWQIIPIMLNGRLSAKQQHDLVLMQCARCATECDKVSTPISNWRNGLCWTSFLSLRIGCYFKWRQRWLKADSSIMLLSSNWILYLLGRVKRKRFHSNHVQVLHANTFATERLEYTNKIM